MPNASAQQIEAKGKPEPFSVDWFTHDAAGYFTALLFLIGGAQACLFVWQLILIRRGLKPAEAAANAALESANHLRTTERAYVRMSHREPGIDPASKKVEIQIKNKGSTPAKIMGVRLGWVVVDAGETLPTVTPYERTEDHPSAQAFLHADSDFSVRRGLEIPDSIWVDITSEQKTLYVIGLVEYVDMFDVWHRAGYARRYAHGRVKNNLPFVSEGGYNYDIMISASERLTGR